MKKLVFFILLTSVFQTKAQNEEIDAKTVKNLLSKIDSISKFLTKENITNLLVNAKLVERLNSDSLFMSQMKLNFSVPEIPAFKALGGDPSTLLKSASPEAISLILPQFYNNGQIVIPKSLGLEFSPYYLINANRKIPILTSNYLKNSFVKRLRVSIGTNNDSTTTTPKAVKLGFGLKLTFYDKGDYKSDTRNVPFMNKIDSLLKNRVRFLATISPFATDSARAAIINAYDAQTTSTKRQIELFFSPEAKEKYKKDNWNADRLEGALALVGRSSDQKLSGLQFNKYSMWLTHSKKIKDWGQWQNGLNYSYGLYAELDKPDQKFGAFSYASRLYAGTNEFKGFLEAQYQYNGLDKSNNGFIHIGGENALANTGIWISYYAGYQFGETVKQVIANLDFRFTLPENNK